jgi:hypothetical protein
MCIIKTQWDIVANRGGLIFSLKYNCCYRNVLARTRSLSSEWVLHRDNTATFRQIIISAQSGLDTKTY